MMNALDERAVARQPQQDRAIRRFDAVLEESKMLLQDKGLEGFSIPELANRLGYTRASIYKFFPTSHAILNELSLLYLRGLQDWLFEHSEYLASCDESQVIAEIVRLASAFYNNYPVACLLTLGGPVTDKSYRAQAGVIQHLGLLARRLARQHGIYLPPAPPDVAMLSVDIGMTCFRASYLLHGEIRPEYEKEAVRAMRAYMGHYRDKSGD